MTGIDVLITPEKQFGFMISGGVNFEKRKYFVFDLPFVSIQIILPKSKTKK